MKLKTVNLNKKGEGKQFFFNLKKEKEKKEA